MKEEVGDLEVRLLDDPLEALQDEQLDSVIIAAPTQHHYEYIRASLESGKHVFTEKPLGKSLEEINHCYDLAISNNRNLFLGFQRRYDHNFLQLKDQMEIIGQPRMIKASSRDNPKPSYEYLEISGNIFHDMLIHDFDMLQFLLGPVIPGAVSAFGYAYDKRIREMGDYDSVLVSIEYDDGLICSIDTSRSSVYGYDQRIEVFANDGMLIAENELENTVKHYSSEGITSSRVRHSFPQRYKDCYKKELSAFFNSIESGVHFNVSREECQLAQLLADAAFESVQNSVRIDFKSYYSKAIKN